MRYIINCVNKLVNFRSLALVYTTMRMLWEWKYGHRNERE